MAKKRIYRVTFNKYTNCTYTSVYSKELDKYINDLYEGSLLIPDHGIEHYMKFGDGIKTLDFVGYMDIDYLIPPNYKLPNCFPKKKEVDLSKVIEENADTFDAISDAIDKWLNI